MTAATLSPDTFKRAFRRHAAGVVVITVDADRGPMGFTATSLTSLSLRPPLISFGISTASSSWPHVKEAPTVIVNFLTAQQEHVARRFATSGIDRFAERDWHRLPSGEPVLTDTNWLRAKVERVIPVGDHSIVVAQVLQSDLHNDGPPLLYHDGTYHSIP
ncbi:flavin-dependent reductase [Lentzea sp. NBRC 105346]|uniref:flavin reductase family protein n=1 Tax=Lentzea sp. NBRC 105346 TaxID=3032205 RepID=UPI0024A08515|nr:flavin reductase family protein [Lentzea sp. NBRC 105346]GLZ33349.1 flavin-dependent reductase [Lentzea sp. NBRC 105346]